MFVTLKTFAAVSFLAIATAGCSNISHGQSFIFKQIALSGNVGRGITDGTKFQRFDVPAISNKGKLLLLPDFQRIAKATAAKRFLGRQGTEVYQALICRTGETAFGVTDNALLNNFAVLTMNGKSDLALISLCSCLMDLTVSAGASEVRCCSK